MLGLHINCYASYYFTVNILQGNILLYFIALTLVDKLTVFSVQGYFLSFYRHFTLISDYCTELVLFYLIKSLFTITLLDCDYIYIFIELLVMCDYSFSPCYILSQCSSLEFIFLDSVACLARCSHLRDRSTLFFPYTLSSYASLAVLLLIICRIRSQLTYLFSIVVSIGAICSSTMTVVFLSLIF